MLDELTVLILTYNERENLGRTLEALRWAKRILIVDSFSTDETLEIARSFPNVQIVQHDFQTFATQCNYGLSLVVTEWVLSIDADYILTPELTAEITALQPAPDISGYSAGFYYNVYGRRLRSTLYPPRTILYRRTRATYRDEGHGHRVSIDGTVVRLSAKIDHDDRKPLSRWIVSQDRYAKIEAKHLLELESRKAKGEDVEMSPQDRLRLKVFFAAPVMFVYLLLARGLILDGWPGWYYVAQRTIAELLLSLRILTEKQRVEENTEKLRR